MLSEIQEIKLRAMRTEIERLNLIVNGCDNMNSAAIAALDKWHIGQFFLKDWREKREALREAAQ